MRPRSPEAAASARPGARRAGRALLSVATTAGLLIWALSQVDLAATGALLAGARPVPLLLAVALGPAQVALAAERWRLTSEAMSLELPRDTAYRELALSSLLNALLPGGMAGDAVRVWRQRAGGVRPALKAAVLDRAVGLAVHLVVVIAGVLAWPWLHPTVGAPLGALLLAVGLLAVPVIVWLGPNTTLRADLARLAPPRLASGVVLPSVLLTASFIALFALCGAALGVAPGAWLLTGVPLVLLAMVVPLSVGGWGPREATATALLPALGLSSEAALGVSAAYGLTALVGTVLAVLIWRPR